MRVTRFEAEAGGSFTQVELDYELEEALWKALRYDFGRHSATTGDVANGLIKSMWAFSNRFLLGVSRDIEGFLQQREAIIESNGGKPLGIEVYEHDVKPYEDLLKAIKEELENRK